MVGFLRVVLMKNKGKTINLILLILTILGSAFYVYYYKEYETKNSANKLNFDFGLIDRLNDCLVDDEPINLNPEDYDKLNITKELWGLETITYFLPVENNFYSASYFLFKDERKSWDAVNKEVYELYFHFSYSSKDMCDTVWNNTKECVYKNRGKPQFVDDLFEFPAIIFKYNCDTQFTYVLRTSEYSIAFISFDSIESTNNLVFNETYYPTKTLFESSFPSASIRKDGSYSC